MHNITPSESAARARQRAELAARADTIAHLASGVAHALARRLFLANQGAFRVGDRDEIMNKVTALSVLSK